MRCVHASHPDWEIVRYNRAGKWYAEYLGPDRPPVCVGPQHLGIVVNSAGRAPVTVRQAAMLTVGLGATHHEGKPGGSTFDREVRKRSRL